MARGPPRNERDCKVRHCRTKHAFKRIGDQPIYSDFCPSHTCRAPVADALFCRQSKSVEDKYCSEHTHDVCQLPGCDHLSVAPRDSVHRYCKGHTCDMEPCYKKKLSLEIPYCRPHYNVIISRSRPVPQPHACVPSCTVPDCHKPSGRNGLCEDHTCELHDCNRQTFDGFDRCINHVECAEANCRFFCAVTRDGSDVFQYCERHISCTKRGCQCERDGGRRFCKEHTCRIRDCEHASEPAQRRQFCSVHTCVVSECVTCVFNPTNPASRICLAHKCVERSCFELAEVRDRCCRAHGCWEPSCFRPRKNSTYCSEHACRAEGCRHAAHVVGGYCGEVHGCTVESCPWPRDNDEVRPGLCHRHLLDFVEERGRQRGIQSEQRQHARQEQERRQAEAEEERRRRARQQEHRWNGFRP